MIRQPVSLRTHTRMGSQWVLRLGLLAVALSGWMVVTACSSGKGGKLVDSAVQDGVTFDFRFPDWPAGCPPAAGNDKNVGAPCAKGGGQSQCGSGLICACEGFAGIVPPENTPCLCTIPILGMECSMIPAGYCGQGASCCSYPQLGSICVPNTCLEMMMCPVL